jgi:GTP cyclohydrolase II
MLADGRGAGLLTKVRGLALGETQGLDTYDAYVSLGKPVDPREYGRVIDILRYFELTAVQLLTNNPRKVEPLTEAGIVVDRLSMEIPPTDASRAYLDTKRVKFGHLLDPKFFQNLSS